MPPLKHESHSSPHEVTETTQKVSAYLSDNLRTMKLMAFKKTQDAVMTQVALPYNILTQLAKATKPVHTNVTGKAIPLQAWTGSNGSRRLRLPDFKKIGT